MSELKKSLGYGTIIAISITSMVGTGMFVGPAIAAQHAGTFSIMAWILLSFLTIYMSLCFGELVSMFPNSGGVYEFAKQSYGQFMSFMVGWVTWLVGNVTTCVVIVTALKFLIHDGFSLSFLPNTSTEMIQLFLAIIIILILNYIAFRGVDASAKLLIFFAIVTVGSITVLLIPGLINLDVGNFTPFFPGIGLFGSSMLIFVSLFWILETYFGWESATFLAEETKNPERIIPMSLLITSGMVAMMGFFFALVMLGNIPLIELQAMGDSNITMPLQSLASLFYSNNVWMAIKIGIFVTLVGSAAGGIVSTPRLLLALARDKLFINSLEDVHPRHKTPHKAIMFQTIVTIVIVVIGFAEYEALLSMLIPLALFMYISVLFSVVVLRFKMPHAERKFKAPLGVIGPLVVIGLYISIITSWLINGATDPMAVSPIDLFKLVLSFIFFGVPIYLLLMFYYDPDVIVKLNDIFAYFTLAFERVLIPRRIDRDIFAHLDNIEAKTVLEFGCGVGTFTKELAKKVGPDGIVYATDVSYTQVKIANKRIAKRGHINVRFIHDIHQVNRVHHSIPYVDAVVSIGMLGYLQDIRKVLREMYQILPDGGRVFFMDYVDLFKFIPNVSWLSHKDELIELFRECGFSVRVEKIKGKLWNYLFIYGIKSEHDVPFI